MPRYIDADKIPYLHYLGDDTAAEGVYYTLKGVIESRVPTEDVAPVVHAHRTINVGMRSYCSNCGHLAYCENYCSLCGAKMDGDKNEP